MKVGQLNWEFKITSK